MSGPLIDSAVPVAVSIVLLLPETTAVPLEPVSAMPLAVPVASMSRPPPVKLDGVVAGEGADTALPELTLIVFVVPLKVVDPPLLPLIVMPPPASFESVTLPLSVTAPAVRFWMTAEVPVPLPIVPAYVTPPVPAVTDTSVLVWPETVPVPRSREPVTALSAQPYEPPDDVVVSIAPDTAVLRSETAGPAAVTEIVPAEAKFTVPALLAKTPWAPVVAVMAVSEMFHVPLVPFSEMPPPAAPLGVRTRSSRVPDASPAPPSIVLAPELLIASPSTVLPAPSVTLPEIAGRFTLLPVSRVVPATARSSAAPTRRWLLSSATPPVRPVVVPSPL